MKRKPISKIKIESVVLWMTAMLFLIPGCMKDNLGDCGLSIRVTYTQNKEAADCLGERVDHLTLYVFDSNGRFVGDYPSRGTLYNGYTIPLLLKSGTYSFVVWGNLNPREYNIPSLVPGETQVQGLDLQFSKVGPQDQVVNEFPDSLYYGAKMNVNIRPALMDEQIHEIDLIKDTKEITVRASIVAPDSERLKFDCHIFSKNSLLRFIDNRIPAESAFVTYLPPNKFVDEEGRWISEFRVIREIEDASTESKLIYTITDDAGTVREFREESLVQMLRLYLTRMSPYTFDIEDKFVIDIRYENYATTSITINGWSYYVMNVVPQ
jgi:hypothetical protein